MYFGNKGHKIRELWSGWFYPLLIIDSGLEKNRHRNRLTIINPKLLNAYMILLFLFIYQMSFILLNEKNNQSRIGGSSILFYDFFLPKLSFDWTPFILYILFNSSRIYFYSTFPFFYWLRAYSIIFDFPYIISMSPLYLFFLLFK